MTRKLATAVLALGVMGVAMPVSAQMAMQPAEMENVEFQAQVVDLSCKLVYNLSGDMHRECAQVCADKGIPLGLLSTDGGRKDHRAHPAEARAGGAGRCVRAP